MTLAAIALAIVCGSAWRRFWGSERPSWAFPGYRAVQASLGVLALVMLGRMAGDSWVISGARAAIVIGFLSTMAESVPHVWRAWEEVYIRWGVPNLGPWLRDWTAWAELTAGALVFGLAMLIP